MQIGDKVLFMVAAATSRERRTGEVLAIAGSGPSAVLTIESDGQEYERPANQCIGGAR
jgi:hypothetical protein